MVMPTLFFKTGEKYAAKVHRKLANHGVTILFCKENYMEQKASYFVLHKKKKKEG